MDRKHINDLKKRNSDVYSVTVYCTKYIHQTCSLLTTLDLQVMLQVICKITALVLVKEMT